MSIIRINKNPTGRQLAVFGVLWAVFFSLVGAWVRRRTGVTWAAQAIWALAVAIPLMGMVWRSVLRWAFLGLSYLTAPIGIVVSYVAMAAIYYLVVTPTGAILRLAGRDPLSRQFESTTTSYWIPRQANDSADRYFRQF